MKLDKHNIIKSQVTPENPWKCFNVKPLKAGSDEFALPEYSSNSKFTQKQEQITQPINEGLNMKYKTGDIVFFFF